VSTSVDSSSSSSSSGLIQAQGPYDRKTDGNITRIKRNKKI